MVRFLSKFIFGDSNGTEYLLKDAAALRKESTGIRSSFDLTTYSIAVASYMKIADSNGILSDDKLSLSTTISSDPTRVTVRFSNCSYSVVLDSRTLQVLSNPNNLRAGASTGMLLQDWEATCFEDEGKIRTAFVLKAESDGIAKRSEIPSLDGTLTKQGDAADAKVTGDAISALGVRASAVEGDLDEEKSKVESHDDRILSLEDAVAKPQSFLPGDEYCIDGNGVIRNYASPSAGKWEILNPESSILVTTHQGLVYGTGENKSIVWKSSYNHQTPYLEVTYLPSSGELKVTTNTSGTDVVETLTVPKNVDVEGYAGFKDISISIGTLKYLRATPYIGEDAVDYLERESHKDLGSLNTEDDVHYPSSRAVHSSIVAAITGGVKNLWNKLKTGYISGDGEVFEASVTPNGGVFQAAGVKIPFLYKTIGEEWEGSPTNYGWGNGESSESSTVGLTIVINSNGSVYADFYKWSSLEEVSEDDISAWLNSDDPNNTEAQSAWLEQVKSIDFLAEGAVLPSVEMHTDAEATIVLSYQGSGVGEATKSGEVVVADLNDTIQKKVSDALLGKTDSNIDSPADGSVAKRLKTLETDLSTARGQIPAIDRTLGVSGAAADAKVVGDKLAEKLNSALGNASLRWNTTSGCLEYVSKEGAVVSFPTPSSGTPSFATSDDVDDKVSEVTALVNRKADAVPFNVICNTWAAGEENPQPIECDYTDYLTYTVWSVGGRGGYTVDFFNKKVTKGESDPSGEVIEADISTEVSAKNGILVTDFFAGFYDGGISYEIDIEFPIAIAASSITDEGCEKLIAKNNLAKKSDLPDVSGKVDKVDGSGVVSIVSKGGGLYVVTVTLDDGTTQLLGVYDKGALDTTVKNINSTLALKANKTDLNSYAKKNDDTNEFVAKSVEGRDYILAGDSSGKYIAMSAETYGGETVHNIETSDGENIRDFKLPKKEGTIALQEDVDSKIDAASIAPVFSTSSAYLAGDVVVKDGKLYKCTSTHSGAWDATHFEATVLTEPDTYIEEDAGDLILRGKNGEVKWSSNNAIAYKLSYTSSNTLSRQTVQLLEVNGATALTVPTLLSNKVLDCVVDVHATADGTVSIEGLDQFFTVVTDDDEVSLSDMLTFTAHQYATLTFRQTAFMVLGLPVFHLTRKNFKFPTASGEVE